LAKAGVTSVLVNKGEPAQYFPAGHETQALAKNYPVWLLYFPGGHGLGNLDPVGQKPPASQVFPTGYSLFVKSVT